MLSNDGAKQSHGERGSVLIVEDEPVSRRALSALMNACGYETYAAGSAEDAIAALVTTPSSHGPRVALVDLDLPGMSGIEFIRQLHERDPEIFAVLITAANGDVVDHIRRSYRVNYLPKPLDFDGLLSLLAAAQQLN